MNNNFNTDEHGTSYSSGTAKENRKSELLYRLMVAKSKLKEFDDEENQFNYEKAFACLTSYQDEIYGELDEEDQEHLMKIKSIMTKFASENNLQIQIRNVSWGGAKYRMQFHEKNFPIFEKWLNFYELTLRRLEKKSKETKKTGEGR